MNCLLHYSSETWFISVFGLRVTSLLNRYVSLIMACKSRIIFLPIPFSSDHTVFTQLDPIFDREVFPHLRNSVQIGQDKQISHQYDTHHDLDHSCLTFDVRSYWIFLDVHRYKFWIYFFFIFFFLSNPRLGIEPRMTPDLESNQE